MKKSFLKAYDSHVDALFSYCYKNIGDKERAASLTLSIFRRGWDKAVLGASFKKYSFFKAIAKELIQDSRPRQQISPKGFSFSY